MTWRDRPYARQGDSGSRGPGLGLPRPTRIVSVLLITNFVVFVLASLTRNSGAPLMQAGALTLVPPWELWRWLTYQYLHGGALHFFFNMLGLYFLGPPLERLWGGRTFFYFYTFCGVVAGIGFAVIQMLFYGSQAGAFLVGASGCVLGCIAACAILFPQMTLILLFFPVPIRTAAVLLAALYTLMIISEGNLSDAAHLAGMAGGVAWLYGWQRWSGLLVRRPRVGRWERKMRDLQQDEAKVDQILDKIRRKGMGSLTYWEKRFLKQASERRRHFDDQQSRRP